VLLRTRPSRKYATRNAQPVGLWRAATPSILICSPGLNESTLSPLRVSTVRDAISQLQVCFAPAASTVSTYTNECGFTKSKRDTTPSIVTGLLVS